MRQNTSPYPLPETFLVQRTFLDLLPFFDVVSDYVHLFLFRTRVGLGPPPIHVDQHEQQ